MENETTLDYLLKIEGEAAALVNDAQAEADRRIHENEEKNRRAFEDRFREEVRVQEASLEKEKEKLKEQYHRALEDFREDISYLETDIEKFSVLLNNYIAMEG